MLLSPEISDSATVKRSVSRNLLASSCTIQAGIIDENSPIGQFLHAYIYIQVDSELKFFLYWYILRKKTL